MMLPHVYSRLVQVSSEARPPNRSQAWRGMRNSIALPTLLPFPSRPPSHRRILSFVILVAHIRNLQATLRPARLLVSLCQASARSPLSSHCNETRHSRRSGIQQQAYGSETRRYPLSELRLFCFASIYLPIDSTFHRLRCQRVAAPDLHSYLQHTFSISDAAHFTPSPAGTVSASAQVWSSKRMAPNGLASHA